MAASRFALPASIVTTLVLSILAAAAAAQEKKESPVEGGLALVPTGACCVQETQNGPLVCVDGITHATCVAAQGIWQGNGSVCGITSCAPTGKCCYIEPGQNWYQCTNTAEALCYLKAAPVYQGDNTFCGDEGSQCPLCILPPKSLAGWWTMDEVVPGIAHDSASIHHAASLPNAGAGPTQNNFWISNCSTFDGVDDTYYVPHSASLTIGVKDFTIDAWVYYEPTTTGQVLFNKGGTFLSAEGYYYGINANGFPIFAMYPGFSPSIYTSTTPAAPNTWIHMAVTGTVESGQRTIRFYLNGVLTDTFQNAPVYIPDAPSFFNAAAICIGSYLNSAYFWKGRIDEVELHMEALTDQEIAAIFAVSFYGKCKAWPIGQWATPLCQNQNDIAAPVFLSNLSGAAKQVNLSFSPTNSGTIPGPTVFTPQFTNPVTVPANGYTTVQVNIQRPVGMNAVNQTAHYLITAAEVNGPTYYTHGSLVDRRDMCIIIDWCCLTAELAVDVGAPTPFHFVVSNSGPDPVETPLYIQPRNPDTMEVSSFVSLNGLPPGTRYIGNLVIPPGAVQPVSVDLAYVAHHAAGRDELIISTDTDADGVPEPLTSVLIRSVPPACIADIAPIDPDGHSFATRNGIVDIDDYTEIILNWGTGNENADIDDDGLVEIDDYTAVVLSWGGCP